jgi:diacylglycerol kinase
MIYIEIENTIDYYSMDYNIMGSKLKDASDFATFKFIVSDIHGLLIIIPRLSSIF